MVTITGNLVNAYYVCKRQLWLYAHNIISEQENQFLYLGRIYDKHFYKRDKKEIVAEGMKIDLIKWRDKKLIVGEIKKSSKFKLAAKMQLVFYLYQLRRQGIEIDGELLIPKEKKREKVKVDDNLINDIENAIKEIKMIIFRDKPPSARKTRYCRGCAYRYFCWA